jgi:hypothetical protein
MAMEDPRYLDHLAREGLLFCYFCGSDLTRLPEGPSPHGLALLVGDDEVGRGGAQGLRTRPRDERVVRAYTYAFFINTVA